MSGRFPNIRYQDSYDSFKYDDILKTEVYDYVKIRGDAGIVNQNISDLVVDGGTISKQGVKIGRAKVGGEFVEANVEYSPEFAGTLSFNEEDDELVIIKKDGTAFDMLHANVELDTANIAGLLTAGSAIIDTSLQTDTLLANSGNVVGDLKAGTITMSGFSVDADGDVISKSINNSNGGITNTGAITDVTDLDGTGDLTMNTITMTGFEVNATGNVVTGSIDNSNGGIKNTGSISNVTDLDGTGDLTMNTITMNGFSVDNNGNVITKSINNSNGGITNAGAITGATEIDVVGNVNVVGDIDGTGDLTMGTITMVGFDVDLGGNVTSASIDNSSGGITNTGSITGATDINASGNLVIGGNMLANGELIVEGNFTVNGNTTIINSETKIVKDHLLLMNYGNSTELNTHSGIIIANVENPPNENLFFGSDKDGVFTSFFTDSTANSADVNVGPNTTARFNNIVLTETSGSNAINTDGDIHVGDIIAKNIDGTGDLTMDTITMNGFVVDTNGNVGLNNNTPLHSLDIVGNANIVGDITGTGDLTMDTITMTGFSVDNTGNVVTKSIDGTGDLTMDTITMTGFSVDDTGNIITNSIDGTGDLTMDTITMTGFSVDTNGNVVTASIDNSNGGIINVGALLGVNDFGISGNLSVTGDTIISSSLGIGTTNPTATLDVNGDIKAKDYKYSGSGATTSGKLFHLEYYNNQVINTNVSPYQGTLVTVLNRPPGVSYADAVNHWVPTMAYYGTTPMTTNNTSQITGWRIYIRKQLITSPGRWQVWHGFPGSQPRTAQFAILWIPKSLMSIAGSPLIDIT